MWRIEFTSTMFLPKLPEQCQGNPGVYGFELAWWLARELSNRGVVSSYPLGEDWGWFIEYQNPDDVTLTIGCSSLADPDEGYSNEPIIWSIFIRPHTSLIERFRPVSHEAAVQALGQHILELLAREQIDARRVEE